MKRNFIFIMSLLIFPICLASAQETKDGLTWYTDIKKADEISKATGIGASSTAFTLKNYTDEFEQDKERKIWKLKT